MFLEVFDGVAIANIFNYLRFPMLTSCFKLKKSGIIVFIFLNMFFTPFF